MGQTDTVSGQRSTLVSIAGPGTTAPVSSLRPPGEGATPSYEGSCTLYRAVDEADLERIQQIDGFRVAPGMTEGKHFDSSATQGSSFARMRGVRGVDTFGQPVLCYAETISGQAHCHPSDIFVITSSPGAVQNCRSCEFVKVRPSDATAGLRRQNHVLSEQYFE